MDLTSIMFLLLACVAGVGIDIALPYIAKLNEWKKKLEQAEARGEPEPDFDVFWPHGKRFNKLYGLIGAMNFLISVGAIFGIFMLTNQQSFGSTFDFLGAFWWAYGQNRTVNNFLSGKIVSAEQLRS